MLSRSFKLCFLLTLAVTHFAACAQSSIRVAAASDLKFALDSVIYVFERTTAGKITVTYGSSGKLYEQISNGAPFDIFFSADRLYPEKLREAGQTIGEPRLYGTGRIVIWSAVVDPAELKMESLLQENIRRIAIANPQHAPYGKRAVEAMEHYGVYEQIKGKLVLGENISQASQYLYSGAAEVGIIALSLALSPPMKKLKGNYYEIPQESHLPLEQAFVVLTRGKNNALLSKFVLFLASDDAREIFQMFGFSIPDEKLK